MRTSRDFDALSTSSQAGSADSARGFARAELPPVGAPERISPLGIPAWAWSLLALAFGVALTLWLGGAQQRRLVDDRTTALESNAQRSYHAIADRLQACELLLRSVQTLFLTSDNVTAQEFANLYANVRPRERFPSLQAMAYSRREAQVDGDHYITELAAPLPENQRVLGLDVNQQPSNLVGVLASRDSDQAVLSAPFRLAQQGDADARRDGVTMRLPVFSPGPPPLNQDERRARMRGSIAISFHSGRLIENSLGEDARRDLHVEVVDITEGAIPLFATGAPPTSPTGYRFEREIDYGGRRWRVRMHALTPVATASVQRVSALLPGLLASVLLALLVWSVARTRRLALELGSRMSRRYRESEERFRALNELLPALVLLARRDDGRISYANQASRARLGETVYEVPLPELFEDELLRDKLRAADLVDCANAEAMLRSVNGDRFWANVSITNVVLEGHSRLLMVASDISEQRQLTELLTYQASHDTLTELYNRREFERRIERVLAAVAAGGPPCALLYIDLDQFKLINDTSGHVAGDQLLSQLATMMSTHLRGGDVLARLGGDEFGVLATEVHDQAGAALVAERLREHIDGYVFVWEQRTYTITASIGGVMLDRPNVTLKDLLSQADTACYMAKESGRNRVHFYSEHDDNAARRRSEMEWANRLRWAIDEGRLLLKYQEVWPLSPQAESGLHLELLLRFRDEQGRLVVPGAFIPAAERYGLMPMIDRWVIETALANFNRLHPSGELLRTATINLSGASIEDETLADLILELLTRHAVAPERVCFEITETVAVRNLAQVARFIERLRAVGCRFALDDFGAGMSSFGYLKNLPVDIIKIDGAFIRDLLTDPMSHAIVKAVTDIGHQRGLKVIAEWVTSDEILLELGAMGVDYAQGYALHQPEPVPFHRR
ncbi:EAL domain-containing protein [Lysobacter sp. 5GHs7-4]|uniref:bifunctional diguanylate cyclase/phosphodiesterase n=1 Tax=Lysobacter sp. 5GHs7-4 TaxID=2904253 RepID=UPI001E55E7DE|nr:EAL domain-containing protein [Lysobacter sp. 5GHs7-4]UHQ24151.1 EAL domain-containing protein [Lysobacter sp. 5GHs7-4]